MRGCLVHIVVSLLLVFSGAPHAALFSRQMSALAQDSVFGDAADSLVHVLIAHDSTCGDKFVIHPQWRETRQSERKQERAGAWSVCGGVAATNTGVAESSEASYLYQRTVAIHIQSKYRAVTTLLQSLW